MAMANLPVKVLKTVISYKLGKPEYNKIKYNHIETLQRIQRRYKINRTEPKIRNKTFTNYEAEQIKQTSYQYYVSRKVPLSVESVQDILMKEADELDGLLDDEDNDNFIRFVIIVEADLRIQFHHFVYDDDEFSSMHCNFHSDNERPYDLEFLEDIDGAMGEAVRKIHNEIDELRDEGNILGIDRFRIKLFVYNEAS